MRRTLRQVGVSRKFVLLADRTPPVVTWLRRSPSGAQGMRRAGGGRRP